MPPPLQVLRPGDRLLARVVSPGGKGHAARLEIGGYVVEATAEVELVPGRLLWLEVAARGPGRIMLRPVPAPATGLTRWPGERSPAAAPPGGGQPGAAAGQVGGGHAGEGRWVVVAGAHLHLEGAGAVEVRFEVPAGPPQNLAAGGEAPAGGVSASTSPPSSAGEGSVPARPALDARPGVAWTGAGSMTATGEIGGLVPDGEAGRVPSGAEKAPPEAAAAARGTEGTPPGPAAVLGEGAAPHATARRDGQPERPARDGGPAGGTAWPRRWRLTLSFSLPHTGRWDWQLAGWGERATVHLAVEEPVARALEDDGVLRDELAGILRGAGLVPAGVHITGSGGGSSPSRPVPAAPPFPGARPAAAGNTGRGGFDVRV